MEILRVRRFVLRAGVALLPLACSGESLVEPAGTPEPVTGVLILSEPQPGPNGPLGYASLPPGTASGPEAVVRNLRTRASLDVGLVDGGFDPVAIQGDDGDSILVEISGTEEPQPSYLDVLKRGRPPVVVRAGPSRGAQQVSLNASIVVVFSTPMQRASISDRTIRLVLEGEDVPATIGLDPDLLRVEVTPRERLRASRDYELVVSADVRSLSGRVLGTEHRTGFRTADQPTVRQVTVEGAPARVDLGLPVSLTAAVLDSAGNRLTDRQVTWSASEGGTISPQGVARNVAPGRVTYTATVEGVAAEAVIESDPVRLADISAGNDHTCAVSSTGVVYCWGSDAQDQIEAGGVAQPGPWATNAGPVALASAGSGTCLAPVGGAARCRADFASVYVVYDDNTTEPMLDFVNRGLAEIGPVQQLVIGTAKGCVASAADTRCWGDWQTYVDPYELGTSPRVLSPFLPLHDEPLRSLTAGSEHACGLDAEGGAVCWGSNIVGELGNGEVFGNSIAQSPPYMHTTRVAGGLRFTAISAGGHHTCALDAGGAAYCWGDGIAGQLGTAEAHECGWSSANGSRLCRTRPAQVEGAPPFASIHAGGAFTCALTPGGEAYCWGDNRHGQLGNGSRTASGVPVPVAGGRSWRRLEAGQSHVCGIATDDRAYCWGEGAQGKLGTGGTGDESAPVAVLHQETASP